jgi:hypothetical protein
MKREYICRAAPKNDHLEVTEAFEVGVLRVRTSGRYSEGPAVYLNREQVVDLRDRLSRALGESVPVAPAPPLWRDVA